MSGLKIVFMGSPDFAIPSLRKISSSRHRIVGVVTQPDKPRGRGQEMLPTAVKKFALDLNISPILQPVHLKDTEFIRQLSMLKADLFVVVAFRILPMEVFAMPRQGTINLHPSLLPRYRGAAPINWTIINGEKETGITIIKITHDIDAGNILLQEKVPVLVDETAGSLHDRLSEMGADLLLEAIDAIADGKAMLKAQDNTLATPAPKIKREDCHISFRQPAEKVKNRIHGLSPYPAAFASLNNKIIKFYRVRVIDQVSRPAAPGTIIQAGNGEVHVACEPGIVSILELQREGKRVLGTEEFLRGQRVLTGEIFE